MKKRVMAAVFGFFLLIMTACSPVSKEASKVEGAVENKPAEPPILYPAYVRSSNPIEAAGSNSMGSADKWGFIDENGQFVIQPEFDYVEPFQDNGLAAANLENASCGIDEKGKIVFETPFNMQDFHEGLAVISKDMGNGEVRCGYIDKAGQVVIMPQFTQASGFVNGKALVQTEEKQYRMIDKSGAVSKYWIMTM